MAKKSAKPKSADSIKWIERAAIKDARANRPVLTAGYVTGGAAVASDGYRLHLTWEHNLADGEFIPFKKTDSDASTRQYPDVWKIVPNVRNARVVAFVDVAEMTQAVKLARVFAAAESRILLTATSGRVYVTGTNYDGDATTAVNAETGAMLAGETWLDGFNADFVLDALAGFTGRVRIAWFADGMLAIGDADTNLRLAIIQHLTEREGETWLSSAPRWIDAELGQTPAEPLPGHAAAAPKRKPAKRAPKVAEPDMIESVSTGDDGKIHERVEIRRGAAAFADVKRRDTPEEIAARQHAEALARFDDELKSALYSSAHRFGTPKIAHRPDRRNILIAVEHDRLYKRAYVVEYDAFAARLVEYVQVGPEAPTRRTMADLAVYKEPESLWDRAQRLAATYGYRHSLSPAKIAQNAPQREYAAV